MVVRYHDAFLVNRSQYTQTHWYDIVVTNIALLQINVYRMSSRDEVCSTPQGPQRHVEDHSKALPITYVETMSHDDVHLQARTIKGK